MVVARGCGSRFSLDAGGVLASELEAGLPAYSPLDETLVTPTEVVVAASEMVRAANLNLFDLAMWYRRPTATEAAMLGAR